MTYSRARLRTWLRWHLPWTLGQYFDKVPDCGNHEWYNMTDTYQACYHCVRLRRRP